MDASKNDIFQQFIILPKENDRSEQAKAPEQHNEWEQDQEMPKESSRAERQEEKKPSIRQALAEKKAETVAHPAHAQNKEHKAPEAAL